jgi:hypothetical protein
MPEGEKMSGQLLWMRLRDNPLTEFWSRKRKIDWIAVSFDWIKLRHPAMISMKTSASGKWHKSQPAFLAFKPLHCLSDIQHDKTI